MRNPLFILLAICATIPLLWFGLMFVVSVADPASAREITVHLAWAAAVQPNTTADTVAKFVDSVLVPKGFSRDQQTHDLDGTNWVTDYSYRTKNYPANTDVMSAGCRVREVPDRVRIELWELGVLRPTQRFVMVRHELKDALAKKYGKTSIK